MNAADIDIVAASLIVGIGASVGVGMVMAAEVRPWPLSGVRVHRCITVANTVVCPHSQRFA